MDRIFEGIVIKISHYKDDNAMVTVVTKDGLKSFLAKGVFKLKSKNARSIVLYNYGQFELLNSKYGNVLKTASSLYAPMNVYSSFDALNCLSLIGETTFNSVNEYDDFDLLTSLLHIIKSMDNGLSPYMLTINYLLILLRLSGEGLDLKEVELDDDSKKLLEEIYNTLIINENLNLSHESEDLLLKFLINYYESIFQFKLKSKNAFYL